MVWLPYYSMGANVGPVGIYGDILRAGGPTLDPPGIRFVGAVGTPALFQPIGVGKWEFVQLCNLLHQQWSWFSPLPNTSSTGGSFWLDNQCPYDTPSSAGSTANNPLSDETSDSPQMTLFSWAVHAKAQDSFQMFMLYLPPGFDVQWAPLARLDWQWNADASKSGSLWTPNPPGAVTANGSSRCTVHPTWTSVYGNQ